MAEPEELIGDALRFVYARVRRHWPARHAPSPPGLTLSSIAPRLDLLLRAVTGRTFPLRAASAGRAPGLLATIFQRGLGPVATSPVPATDGVTVWLPPALPDLQDAPALYRAMALQQAIKAQRGGAALAAAEESGAVRGIALIFETVAADVWLATHLHGCVPWLNALRAHALRGRPDPARMRPAVRRLEEAVRSALMSPPSAPPDAWRVETAQASFAAARALVTTMREEDTRTADEARLFHDWWTGRFESPMPASATLAAEITPPSATAVRTARLRRAPRVRETTPEESRPEAPGPWTVQLDTPHEHVEDPHGLQRPIDRDADAEAGELADAVSDLESARLVRSPGQAPEVLLSELVLPPQALAAEPGVTAAAPALLHYPEWDYRVQGYRDPGASMRCMSAPDGDEAWVARTLETHRADIVSLRRRFEQLRARRVTLRRQLDGSEPDLDACIADRADVAAGLPRAEGLYLRVRPARRDLAVLLLVDASGSTDAWIAGARRIIDVEREALLLVCVALDALGERYAVQSFSGETAQGVELRTLKHFEERESRAAWRRIAALEPERYTRVGAAVRHATSTLVREPAAHRLLLLLSDGKPNDVDEYDGAYGVHDFQRAVVEARLRGIHPFCLTVDRAAASYLPGVFGRGGYALLQTPARLPTVLLDWLRRLITH